MVAVGISVLTIPTEAVQTPVVSEPPAIAIVKEVKVEPIKEVAKETIPEPVQEAPKNIITTPSENEQITWDFLISQGFTRNQTAGIMGNLQQEHGFRTDGDGLAQWIGARKANLMSRADPYSIHTQLNYLMEELNGSESGAKKAIMSSGSVDSATIAFQNKFERCGKCMQSKRIMYAYEILARH